MARRLAIHSDIGARAGLAAAAGTSFGGKRDLYAAAGYEQAIDYSAYLARYLRQDIARRIVNIFADETWRKAPIILDGIEADKLADDTEFALAWRALAVGGQAIDAETRKGLLHYLHRLDRLAGIGQYGVILFGLAGGEPLSSEVKAGSATGLDGLLYVNVFDAGNAKVESVVETPTDPRFGKPLTYKLSVKDGKGSAKDVLAHWTRVIHVTDGALTDDTLGSPRLEASWNRLVDLDKIMAATGEAGWHLLDPGHVISTKDGYDLPTIDDNMSPEQQELTKQAIANQEAQIIVGVGVAQQ